MARLRLSFAKNFAGPTKFLVQINFGSIKKFWLTNNVVKKVFVKKIKKEITRWATSESKPLSQIEQNRVFLKSSQLG